MKKYAKKFIGTIVKETKRIDGVYYTEYYGIISNFDEFKHKYEDIFTTFEKVQENAILYRVDKKDACGSLANLCMIRNRWAKNKFDYRNLYSKKQIKLLLEKGYFIAVQGLKEINLEDLDLLI